MAKLLQFCCFFAWALAVVNGRVQILKAGASCNTKTGEPGVCKLLTECGVYLEGLQNETIEYSSIVICSFIGQDEVICCPNNDLPTLGHIPTEAPETGMLGGPLPPSQNSFEVNRPVTSGSSKNNDCFISNTWRKVKKGFSAIKNGVVSTWRI